MSNKPPGADKDPRAPYNQPLRTTCPKCHGTGSSGTSADEQGIFEDECYYCEGKGII